MTTPFDPYTQLDQEKQLARARRKRYGGDVSLDQAEARHDAIFDMVWAARFWGPFLLTGSLAWIGPHGGGGWLAATFAVAMIYYFARLIAYIADAGLSVWWPDIEAKAYNGVLILGGAALAMAGLVVCQGAIPGAIAIATAPWWWTRWRRRVMAGTDYARLRAARLRPSTPRIME